MGERNPLVPPHLCDGFFMALANIGLPKRDICYPLQTGRQSDMLGIEPLYPHPKAAF